MTQSTPKILGTGLVALDLVVSTDPNSPIKSWTGGTCGNVISILAWLGWDAYPIARMNGDAASSRVKADLARWGVHLDLAECTPSVSTPIIVQEIKKTRSGDSTHRFSWTCLRCGDWLPSFKPVTRSVVDQAAGFVANTSAFFFDRVSRGALDVAAQAADGGAVVMFEPSGRGDEKLFKEALALAHIVKYADQRIASLTQAEPGPNLRLEIQTLGAAGLRFRLPRHPRHRAWRTMDAVSTGTVVDSCGSGDWCTAGLLAKLAVDGISGFEQTPAAMIKKALRYGQELAAWNCAYEGARGGMYAAEEMAPIVRSSRPPVNARPLAHRANAVPQPALIGCPKCVVA